MRLSWMLVAVNLCVVSTQLGGPVAATHAELLAYWAFDEGMMGVSSNYAVITSRQIAADPNVPGFLMTLSGRGIIRPPDRDFWPAQDYLNWHRREYRLA